MAAPLPETPFEPVAAARIIVARVFVRGLKVEAEVGVYAHERGHTQPLVVDVELDVTTARAEHLSQTVNYETIAAAARDLAAEGHIELVETFAERLAERCLVDPRVTRARVRVEKPMALAPHAEAAGVEITAVRV
ncbi:MAG: dihydroneopterin aldolase [Caulobacter sp.]|nr:dihydroneopterin aldolase [Caulobacter sp.]